jgi:hypothetical protein
MTMKSGWFNESKRHSLASRGIKTAQKVPTKMLHQLNSETNQKYEQYIIDSIDASGYGLNPETKQEKLQFLYDTFKKEYWNGNPQAQRRFQSGFKVCPLHLILNFQIMKYCNLQRGWGVYHKTQQRNRKIGFWTTIGTL